MKLWIVMFVVMAAIVIGGFYLEKQVLKTTDSLSHDLDQVQRHVKAGRWQEAVTLCRSVGKKWAAQMDAWSPFIHNHELDLIAIALARAVSLLESRDESAALAEITAIKMQLVQMHHQEILTLQNVF
ncbi:MAG TPA: DUF4363 family protein [Firmicutes bacterium]|nr:DUF4363 family protein [Bacillota bacterium]